MRKYLFYILLIVIVQPVFSQKEDGEKFLHNSKLYNTSDRWFTIGAGGGINTELQDREVNIDAAFHAKVWKLYLQTGLHRSSNEFIYDINLKKSKSGQKINDLYLGVGLRSSKLYSNVAFFAGPSWVYGSKYALDTISGLSVSFSTLGLYANFDYTYKLSYDLGIGVSLYSSYSKENLIYGFRIHLYFSGAFRKEV